MITRLSTLSAMALATALSACAASVPSTRLVSAQASGLQLQGGGATGPALDCGARDGGFGTPDAMKLPKDAFGGCGPQ
jgi:hypothetical protein